MKSESSPVSAAPEVPTSRHAVTALAALLAVGACATHSEARRSLVDDVRRGHYGNAEARASELGADASAKDSVMNLMDRGMVAQLRGHYQLSNRLVDAAKRGLAQPSCVRQTRSTSPSRQRG